MPRLIAALLRHGDYHQLADTPSAHQLFPLTNTGIEQVGNALKVLHSIMVSESLHWVPTVDCSHLLRAWQTAKLLAEQADFTELSIAEFTALSERSVGDAGNLTQRQIARIIEQDPRYNDLPPDWKANSAFRLPFAGAESLLQAGERVAGHLMQRMNALRNQQSRDQLKVFVGHGAAFRHAAFHLGVLEYEQLTKLSMYHCRPVFLEFLADDSWRYFAGEWKIRSPQSDYIDQ